MPIGKKAIEKRRKANKKREKAIEYREKANEKQKKANEKRKKANERRKEAYETSSWGRSQPLNLGAQTSEEPWDPNSIAGSQPLDLGPHSTELYPESEVIYTTEGWWSYEVYTYNEIYKVSTVPADFIGNTQPWPQELEKAYDEYKQTEVSMDKAVEAAFSASWEDPVDHVKVYNLQRNSFELALPAATKRADFMKKWPSAFNAHSNTKGHIGWANGLVEKARRALRDGLTSFQEAWPDKDPNEVEWLSREIDEEQIVGPQTYAMSPEQYKILRDLVQAKKKRIRGWVVGTDPEHWQTRLSPNPTVFRPNLPPLNPTVPIPAYSPEDATRYGLPHHVLEDLGSDKRFT